MKENIQCFILAGGMGTRLKSIISSTPKPMAQVANRPFLEYLIENLKKFDLSHITLLTGYKHELIESHFKDGKKFGVNIQYSQEVTPLGTGGAIAQALNLHPNKNVLILNGDTYFGCNLNHFIESARSPISLALSYQSDTSRYGEVNVNETGQIIQFKEKSEQKNAGFINAGVYFISAQHFLKFPSESFSFESQFLPTMVQEKKLWGIPYFAPFIDIGIPTSYAEAQIKIPQWLSNSKLQD